MPNAGYPSEDFPALSGFTIELADGWNADPTAGMQFAARPGGEVEGFMPNIIGSVKRTRKGVAIAGATEELNRNSTTMTDYAEVGRKEITVNGYPGFHMEFSYRHSPELTLAQIITLVEVDRDRVADLVQITSTCSGAQVKSIWPVLRDMHSSLVIGNEPQS